MRADRIRLSPIALLVVISICGCRGPAGGDDFRRGALAISRYGCGSCHSIRGISGAHGLVGPPLNGIGSRMYVAGMLQNAPENLARWVQDPRAINNRTLMPNLGVTARDAADIAAYLYSLK